MRREKKREDGRFTKCKWRWEGTALTWVGSWLGIFVGRPVGACVGRRVGSSVGVPGDTNGTD